MGMGMEEAHSTFPFSVLYSVFVFCIGFLVLFFQYPFATQAPSVIPVSAWQLLPEPDVTHV